MVLSVRARGISRIEDNEMDTVKAGQSLFRSHPRIAIARVRDGHNVVLGKSLIVLPGLMNVLGDRLSWIKVSLCLGGQADKHG